MIRRLVTVLGCISLALAWTVSTTKPALGVGNMVFAVLGDFGVCELLNGSGGGHVTHPHQRCETQRRVRDLIQGTIGAGAVLTVGDNTYEWARSAGYNVDNKAFYSPVVGSGFFPMAGNHDWQSGGGGIGTYLGFYNGWVNLNQHTVSLAVPPQSQNTSGGRYYHFHAGPGMVQLPTGQAPAAHFFALSSDLADGHGRDEDSDQGDWMTYEMDHSSAWRPRGLDDL